MALTNDQKRQLVSKQHKCTLLQSAAKGECGYDSTKSGSLKLRIMALLTSGAETNEKWRAELCEQHEAEMLAIIRNDCEGCPEAHG